MTVQVIKAITKRIRLRYGSTELAAQACGVPKSVWSGYENADHPDKTIPIGRLLAIAEGDEKRSIAALFADEDAERAADLMAEACEASEAAARVQSMVRLAAVDGVITEAEARPIRAAALDARSQMDDVLKGVG